MGARRVRGKEGRGKRRKERKKKEEGGVGRAEWGGGGTLARGGEWGGSR